MSLWEMLGVSREAAIGMAVLGLGLVITVAVRLVSRRSRTTHRVQIDLNGH